MFLCGVDVRKITRLSTSKCCLVYQRCVAFFWIVYILHVIASYKIGDNSSEQTVKEILARKIPDVIAFLIWLILWNKQRKISVLLNDIHCLQLAFKMKFHFLWAQLGTIIVIAVPSIAWLTMTQPFVEEGCRLLVKYYTLDLFDLSRVQNCNILYFIMAWNQFTIYTLRTCVVVLYIIICCLMRNVLNAHSENGSQKISNNSSSSDYICLNQYFTTYDNIIECLKSLEKLMSFPIFLIQISECFSIFYGFVIKDYDIRKSWMKSFSIGIAYDSILSLISFLCVSFAASSIHEASKNAKEVQEKMLKRILTSRQQRNNQELLRLFITRTSPPFTLSAFGFFHFTRGMILSAVGSVLTYSLLIIQVLK
ncbi:hypothetical protein HNY73_007889 [Argiope bruennichi]|uniref:Gustatory receptor n=1 Tax=Argiope bruennichi TaxID=94029 RepID=A0A8T0F4S0_ARGBR|nr:hypothetical protein HNY73_007889 [Argiope bruennichi]